MDNIANVKFCLGGALEFSGCWLKYVRTALSDQKQNLALCHINEDQVSTFIHCHFFFHVSLAAFNLGFLLPELISVKVDFAD